MRYKAGTKGDNHIEKALIMPRLPYDANDLGITLSGS